MAKYSVEIRDQYGRLVTTILRPMDKQFSIYRNRPGSCQFSLDLFDPQAKPDFLKVNQYDVVFRRRGTVVFAGQISYVNAHVEGDTKKVDVIATGYFDLLDQRCVTPDYPDYDFGHENLFFDAIDSGQVFSSLIDYTQFPLSSDGTVTLSSPSQSLNQSFVAQGDGTVSQLRLLLTKNSAVGNITLTLYPDNNGVPSTVPVTDSSVTIAASSLSDTMAWATFTYVTAPTLANGIKYWIKLVTDTNQSDADGVQWSYLNNDYYLSGRAYSPENTGLFTSTQDLQFFILLSDNSFQMAKNSYLGFNPGAITPSFDISPVYAKYRKIKSCIEDISKNYNGVDFNFTVEIDSDNVMRRYYNVFYPRQGVDNISLNFSYPGNIIKIGKPKDGKTMANELTSRGQGYGSEQVTQTVADSSSVQAYGLRQEVREEPDVPDIATLFTLAQENLRTKKDLLDLPSLSLDGNMSPHLGDFGVGDRIFINVIEAPMLDFSQIYRIEQVTGTINDDDQEEVLLVLSIV